MPSVIIKPTMTGGGSLAYQKYMWWDYTESGGSSGPSYYNVDIREDELGINTGALYFNINGVMNERIPENTYITNLKISLNVVAGRIGETHNLYVSGSNGKETRRFYIKNTFKKGVNVLQLPEEANAFFTNTGELSLYFDENSKYILESSQYYTGEECAPSWEGLRPRCTDTYKMPQDRILIVNRHTSTTNYPTIEVEYAFNPPSNPTSLSPNKEAINPRKPIRFGWDNKYPQSKFELQHRVGTSAWKSITQNTAFKYYEMPYGTITEKEGTLQWRLRTAGENGVYSDWENATCELAVETQKEPTIIRPNRDYIESSRPVRFEWQFISNTSEEQVSFEIEYTLDKNTPVQKITEITSEQFYILEHDHNSSTIAKWRIRVTNNYEEVSEWTDWAEFNIMGAPPIPQILEVSNTNIPTMKWNSKEQEVFEIFIFDKDDNKIYETGKIIGEEIRAYKLNTTLINGKYKFALIVYNKYDVASPQAEFTLIINPEPIDIPDINVHEDDYYIYIRSSIENGQVFRNNHHIGDLINGEFYDYTGANNKLYNYKVRNIVDGVTADSESKSASVNFIYSTLALMSKTDEFIKLDMSLDKLPEQSVNINYDNAQFQLDGRKYPVTEFSDRVTETINIEYFVWQVDEIRNLLDAKEEMIYRDDNGYVFIGVSTGIGYNNLFFGKNTSFTMTKSRDEYD